MKETLKLFWLDFKNFIQNNKKILIICLLSVFFIQFLEKGNSIINISVIILHIIGDVFMVLALTKYSKGENKIGTIYFTCSSSFFIFVGYVAVFQSDENKNWQYFLGTIPFLVAIIYQYFDAWDIKGKEFFNYKLTTLTTLTLAIIYIHMELVYSHAWIQIFGYSLFPIFLGMRDSPKVYLGRIISIMIMLFGVSIDIYYQYNTQEIIPASSISAFFITLIALFGFINNANEYIGKIKKEEKITYKFIKLLI